MLPGRSTAPNVGKLRTNTHPACRSLIQKAVRRGDVSVTRKVASHLREIGDTDWLTKRAAVITFEECWPLGAELDLTADFSSTLDALVRVAQSVKVKDAAGLGTLAYTLSEGEHSVLSGSPEDRHIKIVSEAIKRPKDFWDWVTTSCSQESQRAIVNAAQKAHRRGGWPWDRAFMQAAAYLAITEGSINIRPAKRRKLKEFPFWVALDKHTPQGKQGLREAAEKIGVPWNQLFWVSFYFESALTNEATESSWWSKEVQWRLRQVGLDTDKARLLWDMARPVAAEILRTQGEQLHEHIDPPEVRQLRLFDQSPFISVKYPPFFSEKTRKAELECSQQYKDSWVQLQLKLFEESREIDK